MPVELKAPFTAFSIFPLYRVPSIFRSSENTGVMRVTISSMSIGCFSSPNHKQRQEIGRSIFAIRPTSVLEKRWEGGTSSEGRVSF